MQRKIVRQYYLLSCILNAGGMHIIAAIYVTFLIKNGLNLLEVNLVNMSFFLTLFICEIPTGAFADIFGRKTSVVIAYALEAIGLLVYGLSHSLPGFILAEVTIGVAATFQSGAFSAWLVDSLQHHGYEEDGYQRIFGHAAFLRQVSGGIGAVSGSYMAALNTSMPWFVSSALMGATAFIAYIIMEEPYFKKTSFSWKHGLATMKNVATTSIRYGMTDKSVRFVLIVTCVQIFAVQPFNMYWQPLFKSYDVKEQYLGYIFVGIMAMIALGAYITSKLPPGNERRVIIYSQIITGGCILVASMCSQLPLFLVFFLLHEIPRGCWGPLMNSYLQKRIPSSERATISSFCSVAPHIGGAVGLAVSGIIAQSFGTMTAWIVSALILIIGALLMYRNWHVHPK